MLNLPRYALISETILERNSVNKLTGLHEEETTMANSLERVRR